MALPRLKSWFQCSALPTLGISARGKCLCFPVLILLPGITLCLVRQMFPSSWGDVQDPLGQLLPLHPTLPLIYTSPQQLKFAASSCQASLHDSLSSDLHI